MSHARLEFGASAPGKVNLHLGVGDVRADGYHDLATVFQAVDLRETVRLLVDPDAGTVADGSVVTQMSTFFAVSEPGEDIDTRRNLAWRAVDAVVEEYRRRFPKNAGGSVELPPVKIVVEKKIFVAGGMAGGSADAAAALVAANEYLGEWGRGPLDDETLVRLAKTLGADVPFCLTGGTALGTGRGDDLVEMMSRGEYSWVFINPNVALPTGQAFARLDDMRHNDPALVPRMDTTHLAQALVTGDPRRVAGQLHNDLQPAAVAMRPQLKRLLEVAGGYGLKAIVSGSGPTVALLCRDYLHAANTCNEILDNHHEYEAVVAFGPTEGARPL
ncbi:4-(cytidine 5'-diphospho)-2-C-methyl-D-erythritol kinase [Corynebacterium qintianiae]|uniref:4-diphosphocytidyl-2-C-methyl-D-erythritol kinase n=1 Tax=Corynebacterium qintianiae TaxID=2709392 RepID=A0A7T0KN86_9CORY|nr:4-(cytidine 5'-diphospho)-2-C-methyl-D-erythritol kinase [Corynebacterium qintianiae]QPK83843.1 4-(cytidine 5'-diphospho)-2-C-methyl-D-erythritol kinase [Corynebacterium qintianiae]